MKRIELFEFEDFAWFPSVIRSGMTNLIRVFHRMLGTSDILSKIIQDCRKETDFNQIVDLGSGSGGAMIDTLQTINTSSEHQYSLLLTDKFPNSKTVHSINNLKISGVSYKTDSQDATEIGSTPSGLKTMIASFHHMSPDTARKILSSAQLSNEPILIYEIAENNIPTLIWWLLLPISLPILILMSLVMTPFVKGLRLPQIFFTYIVPVIPIAYAWDGQASLMRTYTFDDIDELLGNQENASYSWKISKATNAKGKKAGYYVFGYPTA